MKAGLRDFAIRESGCVCCGLQGLGNVPCEKHHLNAHDIPGGKRRGEAFTVGLCQWHHVGRCACDGSMSDCPFCKFMRGPSWRYHKREFIDAYGDGDSLLAEQNKQLRGWCDTALGVTYEQLGCEE